MLKPDKKMGFEAYGFIVPKTKLSKRERYAYKLPHARRGGSKGPTMPQLDMKKQLAQAPTTAPGALHRLSDFVRRNHSTIKMQFTIMANSGCHFNPILTPF